MFDLVVATRFVPLLLLPPPLRSVATVSTVVLAAVAVVRLVDGGAPAAAVLVLSLPLVLGLAFVLGFVGSRTEAPFAFAFSPTFFLPVVPSSSVMWRAAAPAGFVVVPSGEVTSGGVGMGAAVVTICTALPGLLRNVPRLPPVVPGEAGFEFDSVAQQNTLFRVVGGSGGIGKSVSSIASQDAAPSLLRWFCASMYRSGSLMGEMGEMLIASAALPGVRMYLLRTLYVLPKSQSVFQFSEMRTDMSTGKRGRGMEISLATTVNR